MKTKKKTGTVRALMARDRVMVLVEELYRRFCERSGKRPTSDERDQRIKAGVRVVFTAIAKGDLDELKGDPSYRRKCSAIAERQL